jgi:hypothetical protein
VRLQLDALRALERRFGLERHPVHELAETHGALREAFPSAECRRESWTSAYGFVSGHHGRHPGSACAAPASSSTRWSCGQVQLAARRWRTEWSPHAQRDHRAQGRLRHPGGRPPGRVELGSLRM